MIGDEKGCNFVTKFNIDRSGMNRVVIKFDISKTVDVYMWNRRGGGNTEPLCLNSQSLIQAIYQSKPKRSIKHEKI